MKYSYALLSIILVVFCCSTEDSVKRDDFVIEDANGIIVADETLIRKWTEKMVQEKFGVSDFVLTNIRTFKSEDSYSAIIDYKISDGRTGNFAVSNSLNNARTGFPCDRLSIKCQGSCCGIQMTNNEFKCSCEGSPSGTSCAMIVSCLEGL
jgi:hypothetical protein